MYIPKEFDVADGAWVSELIERHPLAVLVTADAEYSRVSHLPLIAQKREGALWLIGHVASKNPHARDIAARSPATAVFVGAHAYVSASWYEEPYATVPTWNYTAVHVRGRLQPCDAWGAVKVLSEKMEGTKSAAWDPERLDVRFRENQLRGIVAFELRADAIYAKAKLSQNRTEADQMRVIAELSGSRDQTDRECAEAMIRARSRNP